MRPRAGVKIPGSPRLNDARRGARITCSSQLSEGTTRLGPALPPYSETMTGSCADARSILCGNPGIHAFPLGVVAMVRVNDAIAARVGKLPTGENARKIISPIQTAGHDHVFRARRSHGVKQCLHPNGFIMRRWNWSVAAAADGLVRNPASTQPDVPQKRRAARYTDPNSTAGLLAKTGAKSFQNFATLFKSGMECWPMLVPPSPLAIPTSASPK